MNFKKVESNNWKFVLIKEKEDKGFELIVLFEIFQNGKISEKIFSDTFIFTDSKSISVIKEVISYNDWIEEWKISETSSEYFYKFNFDEFIIWLINFQHEMIWKAFTWISKSRIKKSIAAATIKYKIETAANSIENKL